MPRFVLLPLTVMVLLVSGHVWAADETAVDWWGLHGQTTFVTQYHPGFHSAFSGPNSLDPHAEARETFDLTLYGGLRLWRGAELWVNPEVDQGFGLSNTLGVVGFTSGEAYKVGADAPYFQLPRLFVRQTINLGGEVAHVEAGLNQLASLQTANRVVVTVGKFSVQLNKSTKTTTAFC
jgi:high affinity Mn2+ porin